MIHTRVLIVFDDQNFAAHYRTILQKKDISNPSKMIVARNFFRELFRP